VQLLDERIKLSPLCELDFDFFLDILTCSQIMEHVSKPLNHDEAKAAFNIRSQPWNIKSDGWCTLPITEIECDNKIGWIAFRIINHDAKIAEVGFILKSSVQRRGIISRALTLIKQHAFNELGLNKLVAFCSVHNEASYNVLEKLDFVREGCFKEHFIIDNKYVDSYAYGLCKSAI